MSEALTLCLMQMTQRLFERLWTRSLVPILLLERRKQWQKKIVPHKQSSFCWAVIFMTYSRLVDACEAKSCMAYVAIMYSTYLRNAELINRQEVRFVSTGDQTSCMVLYTHSAIHQNSSSAHVAWHLPTSTSVKV